MPQPPFPAELAVLTWGCILAIVHIFAAAHFKTRQYGTKWNMGPRDEELPPLNPVAGRMVRAQANFFETFPILICAVILAMTTGPDRMTAIGAWLWLGGRVAYLPLYGFGVPVARSLAFGVSLVGIGMLLAPAIRLLF